MSTPKDAFLIDIQVEFYGDLPCVNPSMHPKPPASHYGLLNSIGVGCGSLKPDSTSVSVDEQPASDFIFTDNANAMGLAAQLYKYKSTV
ncbi:MAG: hypothetical protein QF704_17915, partial [Anaerolineales bacterium]|nr:hypothetical protein [Anaerolineales bacterium]